MHETLQRGRNTHSPHLLTLLENRLSTCRNLLSGLQASLVDLSPELTPTHEKLVSILRSIAAANTRSKVCHESVATLSLDLVDLHASFQRRKSKATAINSTKSRPPWWTESSLAQTAVQQVGRILLQACSTAAFCGRRSSLIGMKINARSPDDPAHTRVFLP